jgi:hypothetical protein
MAMDVKRKMSQFLCLPTNIRRDILREAFFFQKGCPIGPTIKALFTTIVSKQSMRTEFNLRFGCFNFSLHSAAVDTSRLDISSSREHLLAQLLWLSKERREEGERILYGENIIMVHTSKQRTRLEIPDQTESTFTGIDQAHAHHLCPTHVIYTG